MDVAVVAELFLGIFALGVDECGGWAELCVLGVGVELDLAGKVGAVCGGADEIFFAVACEIDELCRGAGVTEGRSLDDAVGGTEECRFGEARFLKRADVAVEVDGRGLVWTAAEFADDEIEAAIVVDVCDGGGGFGV